MTTAAEERPARALQMWPASLIFRGLSVFADIEHGAATRVGQHVDRDRPRPTRRTRGSLIVSHRVAPRYSVVRGPFAVSSSGGPCTLLRFRIDALAGESEREHLDRIARVP